MPLSEDEQRILKQIEAELAVDDPKLAASLVNDGMRAFPCSLNDRLRSLLGRRRTGGSVSMLVGFVMLVGGIDLPPAAWSYLWFLPVGGYTLMWGGLAYLVSEHPDGPVGGHDRQHV